MLLLANFLCRCLDVEIQMPGTVHDNLLLPALTARLFLRKLRDTLRVPVLALVDSDPYGLKILSVYMKGVRMHVSAPRDHLSVMLKFVILAPIHLPIMEVAFQQHASGNHGMHPCKRGIACWRAVLHLVLDSACTLSSALC